MRLTKNGITISLNNTNHISAFLSNGWVEAKASIPAKKEEEVIDVEEVKVEKPKKRRQEK